MTDSTAPGRDYAADAAAELDKVRAYNEKRRELAAELKLPLIDSNKADEEHPDKVKMHNLGHPGAEAVANHAETGFAAIVAAWPDKLPVAAAAATPPIIAVRTVWAWSRR